MDNINETVLEVIYSILPIAVVITVLQFTIIWLPMEAFVQFLIGVVFVGIGLILFFTRRQCRTATGWGNDRFRSDENENAVGYRIVRVLLGAVVTIAEPDVRVLSSQIDEVSGGAIPQSTLILAVALGVGIFVGLAMLRIIFNISIVYLLAGGYGLIFLIAAFTPSQFVPISFDAGGVTTGPLTVPFVLALGVGVATVIRGKSASSDGFGLVGLASIGPILSVLILGVIYG